MSPFNHSTELTVDLQRGHSLSEHRAAASFTTLKYYIRRVGWDLREEGCAQQAWRALDRTVLL